MASVLDEYVSTSDVRPAEYSDVKPLGARRVELKAEQRSFVEALPRTTQYGPDVNLKGQTWRYALWRAMYHAARH